MTETIIIGDKSIDKPSPTPIKFEKSLDTDGVMNKAVRLPCEFNYVELISKNYSANFDVMFAYQ